MINKYESQDKPTLERDYKILLQAIQSMIGVERTQELDEKGNDKLKGRIAYVADMLEHYNI